MSLWPNDANVLTPDSLATATMFQVARHRFAALWGKNAVGSLRVKHEMLWQLIREANRWFDAAAAWGTEVR